MDIIALGLSAAGVVFIPLGRKMYNDSQRLAILETNYAFVSEGLKDLKEGQAKADAKLDRLIERFL